jgi:hypothetical protein
VLLLPVIIFLYFFAISFWLIDFSLSSALFSLSLSYQTSMCIYEWFFSRPARALFFLFPSPLSPNPQFFISNEKLKFKILPYPPPPLLPGRRWNALILIIIIIIEKQTKQKKKKIIRYQLKIDL